MILFLSIQTTALWEDISYVNAFGHNKPLIIKPSTQRLHCKYPCKVSNYVKRYREFTNKSNLLSKLNKLIDCVSCPMSAEGQEIFEDKDSSRCKGALLQNAGNDRWLTPLNWMQLANRFMRGHYRKNAKGLRVVSSRLLRRSLFKASVPREPRALPVEDISSKLKALFQEYYN